ncbi:hypothetical protein PMAYCL1PPCAC_25329, partial [Pristionchus mayeri]
AFFYLLAIEFCEVVKEVENHTDTHSLTRVRVNGIVTQMPEFARAFSCSRGQRMLAKKQIPSLGVIFPGKDVLPIRPRLHGIHRLILRASKNVLSINSVI